MERADFALEEIVTFGGVVDVAFFARLFPLLRRDICSAAWIMEAERK
jgi:hypothetical protein